MAHRFESPTGLQPRSECLAEHNGANPGLERAGMLSPAARAFFGCHDVVHVPVGCGATMSGEAKVEPAGVFGTTGGLHVLTGYCLHASRDICRGLPLGGTVTALPTARKAGK